MNRINLPESLKVIKANKESGINSFVMQLYFNDQYPCLQGGLFYFRWHSIEEVMVEWLCLEHDIVVLFSAKDNIKFPDVEMERKFKDLMGTQVQFNPDDKYSRLSMQGVKLFELPKDPVESCYAISKALAQKKFKIAIVIQRAEVLFSNASIDYRLLDSVKSWVTYMNIHTLIFVTDNKENIHREIGQMNPPLVKHLEWNPPTEKDFEKLFTYLKIIKPHLFDGSELRRLASACEGIHYREIENLLSRLENEKTILTEELLKKVSEDAKRGAARNSAGDWLVEKPNITFDQVAGLDEVKEMIEIIIHYFKHPDLLKKRKIRIGKPLLYGPPGTGKTMIGKAIATLMEAPFFYVKAADIKNMYIGESERNIKRLFMEARRHRLSTIFIDEIESIIPRRGSYESMHMTGVVSQFLAEMDGLDTDQKNPILVIGATNRPQDIDSAALRPGRFDNKILVSLPDKKARKQIFNCNLKDRFTADIDYHLLVAQTEGYSGADISGICERVEYGLSRLDIIEKRPHLITTSYILETIRKIKPSVSKEEMEWFRNYDRTQNGFR